MVDAAAITASATDAMSVVAVFSSLRRSSRTWQSTMRKVNTTTRMRRRNAAQFKTTHLAKDNKQPYTNAKAKRNLGDRLKLSA